MYQQGWQCPICKTIHSPFSLVCCCSSIVIETSYKGMTEPFDANQITLDNWNGILKVQKKPLIIHAVQLNFPKGFKVDTLEGTMNGKPGDYLMFGIDGEKYICDKDIFERTYDIVE